MYESVGEFYKYNRKCRSVDSTASTGEREGEAGDYHGGDLGYYVPRCL